MGDSKLTDTLNKLSNRIGAKSVSIYDFPTLYTSTPHDKLIKTQKSVIGISFEAASKTKDL